MTNLQVVGVSGFGEQTTSIALAPSFGGGPGLRYLRRATWHSNLKHFEVSGQSPAVNGLAPLCAAGVSAHVSFLPRGRSARSSSDTKPLDGHSSKRTFAEKIPC